MTRQRRPRPERARSGFDARAVLSGDLDDATVRDAVEGWQ